MNDCEYRHSLTGETMSEIAEHGFSPILHSSRSIVLLRVYNYIMLFCMYFVQIREASGFQSTL